MKYIVVFFLLVSVRTSSAQAPAINYFFVDEPSRTLFIHGSKFGLDSGSVTVDSVRMPITRWSDTLVACSMPDSGRGFAGEVKVALTNGTATLSLLSGLNFVVHYMYYIQPPDYRMTEAYWYVKLRVDLLHLSRLTGTTLCASRSTTSNFNIQSSEQTRFITGSGGGSVPWKMPDSSGTGFQILLTLQADMHFGLARVESDHLEVGYAQHVPSILDSSWVTYQNISLQFSMPDVRLDSNYRAIDTTEYESPPSASFYEFITYSPDSSTFLPARLGVISGYSEPAASIIFYPNPAHNLATISFALPTSEQVHVEIIDALGRSVGVLSDSYMTAGNHSLRWRSSDFTAGVYFCRVQSSGQTQVARIVTVR